MVRAKVCCIRDREELSAAVAHGASAVGFVSDMPSGPGVIPDDVIAELVPLVPEAVWSELLTSLTGAEEIIEQQQRLGPRALQLCHPLPEADLVKLRDALPGVTLVHVVHVAGPESVLEAVRIAPLVDGLLLDTGRREGPDPELGGTGRVHDWSLSAEVVRTVEVPVFLAGGLNPSNVAEAIRQVRPFGVDVCSGVRTDDRLDVEKLARFMDQVKSA